MLHLEGALSEAELAAGLAAVEQGLEEGKRGEIWCLNKQMESLCFHPALWPIVRARPHHHHHPRAPTHQPR